MEKHWNNPEDSENMSGSNIRNGNEENESLLLSMLDEDIIKHSTSRRDFLKVFGFSFASAAILASCKRPVHKALPYIIQPPEIIPGKSLYYATTYFDGHEY